MRKVIAAINMTLDGFCDHTAVIPDEEIHYHYAELLDTAGVILYGRKTYELMQYWQALVKEPSGNKSMDDFAVVMDRTPKLVFSHTLKDTGWESAKLAEKPIKEVVLALKQQEGKPILVGSPSLIVSLTNLDLIDEYQLCIHPVVAAGGLPLFKNVNNRLDLKLLKTKTFSGGAELLYYEPVK
ncbi:MAG TPA: dihydrofolate reductase family protein [Flavipsychrobacter sp.]|nr:dihydrofolate reductase family protein [Flavipsychrobacter sp.]